MGLVNQLDTDWDIWADICETVSYVPYNPVTDGYGAAITGVTGLGRVTDKREHGGADDASVFAAQRRWHLQASTMGGTEPTVRGKIVQASGAEWLVEIVSVEGLGTRYVCETVRV